MFRKFLITGGYGFLGQHLIQSLISEFPDSHFKVLDLKHNHYQYFKLDNQKQVDLVIGKDICSMASIKAEFSNIDCIIHLAGMITFSYKDQKQLYNVNVNGTKNVLRCANIYGIKNFIHISSVAARGFKDCQTRYVTEEFQFNWSIAKNYKKYYMLTKHLADLEVIKARDNGLKAIIIYPGLMWGPGDLSNTGKLIGAVKNGQIPFICPGGSNSVDVRDVVAGIIKTILLGKFGEDYILSGENLLVSEVFETIAGVLNVQPPHIRLPARLHLPLFHLALLVEKYFPQIENLYADVIDSSFRFRYFDNAKAKNDLNWQPRIPFNKSVRDSINWINIYG